MQLVLSLFSGIDLFGQGFEENGFCVVSAGDIILGQDIRRKKFVPNKFEGVVDGAFASTNRNGNMPKTI
jgi:DNA (cytosine-5)-methyltransferase 1